jgi:hypothetical protein
MWQISNIFPDLFLSQHTTPAVELGPGAMLFVMLFGSGVIKTELIGRFKKLVLFGTLFLCNIKSLFLAKGY